MFLNQNTAVQKLGKFTACSVIKQHKYRPDCANLTNKAERASQLLRLPMLPLSVIMYFGRGYHQTLWTMAVATDHISKKTSVNIRLLEEKFMTRPSLLLTLSPLQPLNAIMLLRSATKTNTICLVYGEQCNFASTVGITSHIKCWQHGVHLH